MDTNIAEKILEESKGKLDECEICLVRSESKETKFASNKLKSSQGKGSRAVAVRGFLNGKMGFYTSSDFSSVPDMVSATVELARVGSSNEIDLPDDFGTAGTDIYDKTVDSLSPAELADVGRGLIEKINEFDPKFLCEARVDTEIENVFLGNSRGGRGDYARSVVTWLIMPSFTDESGFLEIFEYDFRTDNPEREFNVVAERVMEKLRFCEKDAKAVTGEYEILLMPKATSIFGPLLLAINGRAVLKGYSSLKEKLGEKVADERVTIIDDPLAAGYIGSQPFDDEGTPSRLKPVIENGILKTFLHDLFSAGRLGQEPTGNAFRNGISGEPRASASTLFFAEGDKDFHALVANMKKGIIVDQIMGAHQSSPFSGDFNVNIDMGWLVDDGEIVGRIKDCMLAGNIFKWLEDGLIEVGKGCEKPSTSLCIPPLLFADGKIAAG